MPHFVTIDSLSTHHYQGRATIDAAETDAFVFDIEALAINGNSCGVAEDEYGIGIGELQINGNSCTPDEDDYGIGVGELREVDQDVVIDRYLVEDFAF